LVVEVVDVKINGLLIEATLPNNKMKNYKIDNAPKDLKVGDEINVSCKMKKDKFDFFVFISKV